MSAISTLIERHKALAEQEAGDRAAQAEARYRETLEQAQQAFYETLGNDVWGELRQIAGRPTDTRNDDGTVTELIYRVETSDLLPFSISAVAQFNKSWSGQTREMNGYRIAVSRGLESPVYVKDAEVLGAFLAAHTDKSAEWKEALREKRVREIFRRLYNNPCTEPAEAAALRAELAALGQEEKAQELHEQWRAQYEERLRQEQEQRENRKRVGRYALALRNWQREGEAFRALRDEKLKELQRRFDAPFTVYRLVYGVLATGEDGEPFAGTRETTVLSDRPGPDGYYQQLEGYQLRPFRPAHVVSFTREQAMAGAEGVRVEEQGVALFVSPYRRINEAREAIREMIAGLPAAPEAPDPFVVAALEEGRRYDTGARSWSSIDDVRENVLTYGVLPLWVDES